MTILIDANNALALTNRNMTPFAKQLLLSFPLLLAAGVSYAVAPAPSKPLPANIKGWSPTWLVGTTLDLVSDTSVLTLRFGEGDWATMTAGEKGGPITAPVVSWHIENGKLFIGESAEPRDGMEFVSISGNKLTVRSKGKNAIYHISR